ncbi:MAG TPA: hypothetical protein VK465_07080 [Fibrobacteria bacterium]|nr:hypothetical protein [Fibrobacteria bacterium]
MHRDTLICLACGSLVPAGMGREVEPVQQRLPLETEGSEHG